MEQVDPTFSLPWIENTISAILWHYLETVTSKYDLAILLHVMDQCNVTKFFSCKGTLTILSYFCHYCSHLRVKIICCKKIQGRKHIFILSSLFFSLLSYFSSRFHPPIPVLPNHQKSVNSVELCCPSYNRGQQQ